MHDKKIDVIGKKWDSSEPIRFCTVSGLSLKQIVLNSIKIAYKDKLYSKKQYNLLLKYARCKLDGIEIERKQWGKIFPDEGARIEILHGVRGGGGGGGGKNPVATVLSAIVVIVATAVTWWAGGIGGEIALAGLTGYQVAAGVGCVAMGALMAINALFPAPQPSLDIGGGRNGFSQDSQTYSITGGKNSANIGGYVPMVLGKHRMTPPLGGRSWTVWEGNQQFFHMLVVWGHPDITVTDFKIGGSQLSLFKDVTHKFHQSTRGNDLKFFAKSYKEEDVGVVLINSEGWSTRVIEDAEAISLDFSFQRGLFSVHSQSGNRQTHGVKVRINYRKAGTSSWSYFDPGKIVGDGGNNYGVDHDANTDIFTFSGCCTTLSVRNVRLEGLDRANYEVRCKRESADLTEEQSKHTYDEVTWGVARAILNQPAFNTPIPICVSELRIRATEQLSNYVDDFNALVQSNIPDWNGSSWVKKNTSNPASIMRYLLTSRHGLANPYSTEKLDDAKLQEFWTYCNQNGYEFNFICDTETSVWERLVQVLSVGRGAPTTDVDGKWGVVIDRGDKTPVQLFTPRNSWGLKIERGFAKLPDALRVSFIDETQNYEQREAYVYNDGYSENNAQDVISWDFPGITNWDKIWKQGRMYLSRALHRQMTLTLQTDWEWLVCHRGDLVGVSSDVLMNVFGTARIKALIFKGNNNEEIVYTKNSSFDSAALPCGCILDDTILFSEPSPARYGIAVRTKTGSLNIFEIIPQYDQETDRIYFKEYMAVAAKPYVGDLCSVSLLGSEYSEYLVASMSPGDNLTCEITLIPYKVDEIEAAITGEIPPYDENVILDIVRSAAALPTPTIVRIASDLSVLNAEAGIVTPRICVWWSMPKMAIAPESLYYQGRAIDKATKEIQYGIVAGTEPFITIEGVIKGHTYTVQIRATNSQGVASKWSSEWTVGEDHTVLAEDDDTIYPPDVTGFTLEICDPSGIKATWNPVDDPNLDHYLLFGPSIAETKDTYYIFNNLNGIHGELEFFCVAVNKFGIQSRNPARATIAILPPLDMQMVQTVGADGVYITWQNCKTTWSIRQYVLLDSFYNRTYSVTSEKFAFPPRPLGIYQISGTAVDIFYNESVHTCYLTVTISQPNMPYVTVQVDTDGTHVSWQDCAVAFPIDYYVLTDPFVLDKNGKPLKRKVKGTSYTFKTSPAGDFRIEAYAVDIYGNTSMCCYHMVQVKAPVQMQMGHEFRSNGLYLYWYDAHTTWLVDHYKIYNPWTKKWLKVKGLFTTLPYGKSGTYQIQAIAVDKEKNESSVCYYDVTILNPDRVSLVARFTSTSIVFSWPSAQTTWPIETYKFHDFVTSKYIDVKGLTISVPAVTEGDIEYSCYAVDKAGNVGEEGFTTITVGIPTQVSIRYSLSKDGIYIYWTEATATWPIDHYEVFNPYTSKTEKTKALQLTLPIAPASTETVEVRAVDTVGNKANPSYCEIVISAPFALQMSCEAGADGCIIKWQDCTSTWPMRKYRIYDEYTDRNYETTSNTVTLPLRPKGRYHITGVGIDIYGNEGTEGQLYFDIASPPQVRGVSAEIANPSGVKISWTAASYTTHDHYRVYGAAQGKTKDTQIILPVPKKTGELTFYVVAVDRWGIESDEPTAVNITVLAPYEPVVTAGVVDDKLAVVWTDAESTWSIDYYTVLDVYLNETHKIKGTSLIVTSRAWGNYVFNVTAFDIFGNRSVVGSGTIAIEAMATPEPTVSIDDRDFLITWPVSRSTFRIAEYLIANDANVIIGRAKVNYFRTPALPAGAHGYRVQAKDIVGNLSAWGECAITTHVPEAPVVTVKAIGTGMEISWEARNSDLPIDAYDVVRQWEDETGLKEHDYGRLSVTSLTVDAVCTGAHSILVRAIDSAGNISPFGEMEVEVRAPGKVTIDMPSVIDNNVMLYWSEPNYKFFDIAYYLLYELETYSDGTEYEALVGHIDARFATIFEEKAGLYKFRIYPVDVAGNIGEKADTAAVVSQPPDFIFYTDKESLYNGTKTNFVLDGQGGMIGPVIQGETWQQQLTRMKMIANADITTWQQKINKNWKTWLEPVVSNVPFFKTATWNGATWACLVYQYVKDDNTGLFPSKDQSWNYKSSDNNVVSTLWMLRDMPELFRNPSGKFEFLMFQSDATGPFTGNSTVYSRWEQSDNPVTTSYAEDTATSNNSEYVNGYEEIAYVGSRNPTGGLALSSNASALLDGNIKHSNWFGAVATNKIFQNGIPALTQQKYSQLWVRIDNTAAIGQKATYVETVDVGAIVPSTKITVTVQSKTLLGDPHVACKIDVSQDNVNWTNLTTDGYRVYGTNFRYIRFTLTLTGGMICFDSIRYTLNVKKMADFGSVMSYADDNGDGFISVTRTPNLYGTYVPFHAEFTDIQSGPFVTIVKESVTDDGARAYCSFQDVMNPQGFRVWALDKDGNRINAVISWEAFGA